MRNLLIPALLLTFAVVAADAQTITNSGAQFTGSTTPGNCVKIATGGAPLLADAGGACGAGSGNTTISPATGNTAGHVVTMSNTTTTVTDSGTALSALAPLVSPSFTTPTLGAATATSINKMAITAPATSSTLAVADGKTATISNTLTFTGTDTSSVAFGAGGTVDYVGTASAFTAAKRASVSSLAISTATFTPNFDTGQGFTMTLVHGSCPCTLANPSTTPVAGQSGVIEIIQSATGSDTIGTWGSDYTYAGGTSLIALSAGANARDYLSYYVADATHIVLSTGALNATH